MHERGSVISSGVIEFDEFYGRKLVLPLVLFKGVDDNGFQGFQGVGFLGGEGGESAEEYSDTEGRRGAQRFAEKTPVAFCVSLRPSA